MTEGTAIDLAKKRMQKLGITDYLIRYRHLQIAPLKSIELEGENNFYYLIQPGSYTKVQSKAGVYDLRDNAINEMQYIHRGRITVSNLYQKRYLQVKFIQVIPAHKKHE